MTFLAALEQQRWDDHRYYHHSRINQSLHLFSAFCFIAAYGLLLIEPAIAVMVAWGLAMPSRQVGHFFFEPKGYDVANRATHEYKEAVKVGYNLRRKVVLMTIWALSPLLLAADSTLGGWLARPTNWFGALHNLSVVWFLIGVAALVARTVQLFFIRDFQSGVVWATKILTDPFHDVALYHRAPLQLLRGQMLEPVPEHPTA
jgi:hypothetical protein